MTNVLKELKKDYEEKISEYITSLLHRYEICQSLQIKTRKDADKKYRHNSLDFNDGYESSAWETGYIVTLLEFKKSNYMGKLTLDQVDYINRMFLQELEDYANYILGRSEVCETYEIEDINEAKEFLINNDVLLDDDYEKTAWEIGSVQALHDIIYRVEKDEK